jgi:hypothetical protein
MTSNEQPNLEPSSVVPTKKNRTMRSVLFVLGGAVAGFLYYKFVGCRTGACPITSSPIVSTLYGAAMGFLLGHG